MADRKGLFLVVEGADGAGSTTQADRLAARLRARGERVVRVDQPARQPAMMTAPGALVRAMLAHEQELPASPTAMQMLFIADRFEQHARVIDPALARGEIVVSDRGELSTLVYGVATEPLYRCTMPTCAYRSDYPLFPIEPSSDESVARWDHAAGYLDFQGARFQASLERAKLLRHALHRVGPDARPHDHALLFAVPLLASALMGPHRLLRAPDLTLVLQVSPGEARRRRTARGLPAEAFDGVCLQERVNAGYGALRWLVEEALPRRYTPRTLQPLDADASADMVERAVWAAVGPLLGDRSA